MIEVAQLQAEPQKTVNYIVDTTCQPTPVRRRTTLAGSDRVFWLLRGQSLPTELRLPRHRSAPIVGIKPHRRVLNYTGGLVGVGG